MNDISDSTIINCVQNYRQESSTAKFSRMEKNKMNFSMFNLEQDFSYKQAGQSREFLPKVAMGVEQAANFLQQGLSDIGDWFRAEPQPGINEDALKIKPKVVYTLLDAQLKKLGFLNKVGDAAKLGLIGSLMIAKVRGKYVYKPRYVAKTELKNNKFVKSLVKMSDKSWQLEIDLIRQEDYYPDPTGRGLYELQDLYMDYYALEALATGENAIYDLEAVKQLKGTFSQAAADKKLDESRETGQNITFSGFRNEVKLTEVWGNILNEEGELIYENIMCTIANDQFVIQKPIPNPYWHKESPFVTLPILSVPHSVWGKALMDAPAMLNRAANELFNLILDGGLMAVHGIKQIREDYLEDASQIEDGVAAGDTLRVNSACPPGAKVLERVDTSAVPTDGMNVMNLLSQELNVSMLTNDLRMGVASFRAVKATEVAEASQTISSMFSGMAKNIEGEDRVGFITPILNKAWKTIAQHISEIDESELKALIGDKEAARVRAMGAEEIFADTVQGCKFQTFGISATLNKQKDFTKMTALLQTIGTSEVLTEAFMQKYDFTKILGEIMRSLDINTYKIEADKENGGDLNSQGTGLGQGEMPNVQSQIPQAGAASNQGDLGLMSQAVPTNDLPASRATPAQ